MIRRVLLFTVCALALMYPSIRGMVAFSDRENYTSIAENLVHGRGAVNYTGNVELVHPFGYSLAMAPWMLLGLSGRWPAFMVNWFSLIVIGLVAWLLLRDLSGKTGWQITVGAVLVMAAVPLMTWANVILTEAMCAALALTFCWLCWKAAE